MASTRQYPKYVRVTETTLGYQRSIPKRYAHLTKKRLWSYPLGLSPSASDATIYASVIKAEESYQLFLKRLESTDPSAYTDTEIDRLAEEILRKRSLKPGLFNKVSDELGELAPDDLADIVLPEVEDIRFKRISSANHQHDITELAFLRAHKVLQERQTNRPKTLVNLVLPRRLARSGVPVLTIHDGFIVPKGNEDLVREFMYTTGFCDS